MTTTPHFLGALALAATLSAACGNVVDVTGGSDGTGSTGASGSHGTGGAGTGGSGGSGAGKVCGPNLGGLCAPDEYCDFPDHQCGENDGNGVCTARPGACPKNLEPTCACDGMIYDNPCEANQAGFDQSDFGGCAPPVGSFGCGHDFCELSTEYCFESGTNDNPAPTYVCKPLPSGCSPVPSCGCLMGQGCGTSCQTAPDGGLILVCMGV